ncbi:STAS domain-containing protein [Saccharopolyspora sp. CA-218241]|uniref:STAS domain-containing protein n=1 Tax=Saccharopolyspora sp. CA-218241 TaxID=3240027 RepID=UPI003D96DCE7
MSTTNPPEATPADAPEFGLAVEWDDRTAIVVVSGEVDMLTAPRLQERLLEVLERSPAVLLIDLSGTNLFASAGLSAVVAAYQSAGDRTSIRVVSTHRTTERPFRMTALDRKIALFDSREAALRAES